MSVSSDSSSSIDISESLTTNLNEQNDSTGNNEINNSCYSLTKQESSSNEFSESHEDRNDVSDKIKSGNESDDNANNCHDNEQYKLGGRSPFSTICHLMIGPLISQISQSCYGLMDSFWVSKSIGQKGMTVMSLIIIIDFINIAFAQFFNVAMSARISYLLGQNNKKECAQVVVDILRICIIVGIILPLILIPCVKPMIKWYGGNEEIISMAFEYLVVSLCCGMINYTYLSLCGLLQAMGNSMIYGLCHLTSSCLNMFIFDPLFLLGFKTGMWGVSLATALSNMCPMLFLFICIFCGKFTIKPKFSSYLMKFNMNSFDALRVSISQFISNLATSLPVLLLSKLLSKSATNAGIYIEIMAAWNVCDRLYTFAICICNGLNQGFLPAASYAFGQNNLSRLSKMYFITIGMGTIWTTFVCILIETIPHHFARIWGSDPHYLEVTSKSLRIQFIACMANQVVLTTTACLQSMKMVILSIINSVITMLVPIPLFSLIIFNVWKNDPIKLMYSFVAHDAWALLFSIGIIIIKLRFLWKSPEKIPINIEIHDDEIKS
ncbi:MatE family protein [Tritrichomonas foetus]|uniref:MatE family protein n=1 Tax=Tritrichomonas foetus TaxID=1144522 RepID=A0A1J4JD03_9EUKA|nr:MatE family protein [Tritrichomonas foetus]|eukprot:OHS95285.1 MatE family protein [Tritrichomonas foetus]